LLYREHSELLERVAAAQEVDLQVLESMLDLGTEFRNLHSYGARPALRRRLTAIVDGAIRTTRAGDLTG